MKVIWFWIAQLPYWHSLKTRQAHCILVVWKWESHQWGKDRWLDARMAGTQRCPSFIATSLDCFASVRTLPIPTVPPISNFRRFHRFSWKVKACYECSLKAMISNNKIIIIWWVSQLVLCLRPIIVIIFLLWQIKKFSCENVTEKDDKRIELEVKLSFQPLIRKHLTFMEVD